MAGPPSLTRAQMKQVIEEGGSVLAHTGDGPKLYARVDQLPPDVDVLNPSDPVAVRAALQDADQRLAAAHSERQRLLAMQAAAAERAAAADPAARETMPWEGTPRKRRNRSRRTPKPKAAARAAKKDEPPKE
jgi:hypothetical protein